MKAEEILRRLVLASRSDRRKIDLMQMKEIVKYCHSTAGRVSKSKNKWFVVVVGRYSASVSF